MSTNKDPVCGVSIEAKTAKLKSVHQNNVYYFCSSACQTEFNRNPEEYLRGNTPMLHASHYAGYCPTPSCGAPSKGLSWYFYIGLILLIVLLLLLLR